MHMKRKNAWKLGVEKLRRMSNLLQPNLESRRFRAEELRIWGQDFQGFYVAAEE